MGEQFRKWLRDAEGTRLAWLKNPEFAKMIKFGITGVMNTLVDYGVFTMLVLFGLNPYISQVCSCAAGMLNSYLVNRSWTFQSRERFFSPQMVKFIFVNLLTLGISLVLLKVLIEWAGWYVLGAKLGSVCVTLAVNFVLNRLWVFR